MAGDPECPPSTEGSSGSCRPGLGARQAPSIPESEPRPQGRSPAHPGSRLHPQRVLQEIPAPSRPTLPLPHLAEAAHPAGAAARKHPEAELLAIAPRALEPLTWAPPSIKANASELTRLPRCLWTLGHNTHTGWPGCAPTRRLGPPRPRASAQRPSSPGPAPACPPLHVSFPAQRACLVVSAPSGVRAQGWGAAQTHISTAPHIGCSVNTGHPQTDPHACPDIGFLSAVGSW